MTAGDDFEAMSVDALWQLHERLRVVLLAKIAARRQTLDQRLHDIEHFVAVSQRNTMALQPAAGPVYRNPDQPSQVWSGRGLRPRWLVLKLAAGFALADFRFDADGSVRDAQTQSRA